MNLYTSTNNNKAITTQNILMEYRMNLKFWIELNLPKIKRNLSQQQLLLKLKMLLLSQILRWVHYFAVIQMSKISNCRKVTTALHVARNVYLITLFLCQTFLFSKSYRSIIILEWWTNCSPLLLYPWDTLHYLGTTALTYFLIYVYKLLSECFYIQDNTRWHWKFPLHTVIALFNRNVCTTSVHW